jgi:hypothetical protein
METLGNLEFDEIWSGVSRFSPSTRKINFPAKVHQKLEFLLKVGFEMIYR